MTVKAVTETENYKENYSERVIENCRIIERMNKRE
jgi:hypothetical protein